MSDNLYQLTEEQLKELIRQEHCANYYRIKEEYGERYCWHSNLFEDISEEKLEEELSYYKKIDNNKDRKLLLEIRGFLDGYLKSYYNQLGSDLIISCMTRLKEVLGEK